MKMFFYIFDSVFEQANFKSKGDTWVCSTPKDGHVIFLMDFIHCNIFTISNSFFD